MTKDDYSKFFNAWVNAHAMSSSNQIPSNQVVSAVFDVLSGFDLRHVLAALQMHSRKSRFAPTPADICEIIEARTNSKHIGADEAWGIVLESFDEESTVVMTKEIAEARGLVMEIYRTGDVIGARMAFRDSYNRIVMTANGKPIWFISAGRDGTRRADAIARAIDIGRLPKSSGYEYVLGNDKPTATVAVLIESANKKAQASSDAEFRKSALRNIGALKTMLDFEGDNGVDRREEDRKKFELHRQNELKRLAEKSGLIH